MPSRRVHILEHFGIHLCAGAQTLTRLNIESMGVWVTDLLSDTQLAAAAERYNAMVPLNKQFMIPIADVRRVFMNHFHKVMRMPAGGALAGGSMQTGFEMELVTLSAVHALMEGWPNHQEMGRGSLSWEVRSMEEMGPLLAFEKEPAGWGMQNGKPISPLPQTHGHRGVLMASPPLTVTWSKSTSLVVRFPITIWSDDNMMILPPDDAVGRPFYQDPPSLPGYHRDLFKKWAHTLLGELHSAGVRMTSRALAHLPPEYRESDSSCPEEDERSFSEEEEEVAVAARPADSSDEEGAHQPWYRRPG